MTSLVAAPMPVEARVAYANWLWTAVNLGDSSAQQQIQNFDEALGEPEYDILARRNVARRAQSLPDLEQLLDMLALWPGQQDLRKTKGTIRATYGDRTGR